MRKAVLMLLLALLSGSAAAEWVKVDFDGNATVYANPASIRKAGNRVKMWNLIDYMTAQAEMGRPYMSVTTQSEFDCKKGQTRSLYLSFHSGHMNKGHTVGSVNESGKWIPVVAGSMSETLWQLACGK